MFGVIRKILMQMIEKRVHDHGGSAIERISRFGDGTEKMVREYVAHYHRRRNTKRDRPCENVFRETSHTDEDKVLK